MATNTKRNPVATKKNVRLSSYTKNLGKSLGYIGMDIFRSYAPVMSSLASSSKEAASSGYASAWFRGNICRSTNSSESAATSYSVSVAASLMYYPFIICWFLTIHIILYRCLGVLQV